MIETEFQEIVGLLMLICSIATSSELFLQKAVCLEMLNLKFIFRLKAWANTILLVHQLDTSCTLKIELIFLLLSEYLKSVFISVSGLGECKNHPCDQEPCDNGAECHSLWPPDTDARFLCHCQHGYTGKLKMGLIWKYNDWIKTKLLCRIGD